MTTAALQLIGDAVTAPISMLAWLPTGPLVKSNAGADAGKPVTVTLARLQVTCQGMMGCAGASIARRYCRLLCFAPRPHNPLKLHMQVVHSCTSCQDSTAHLPLERTLLAYRALAATGSADRNCREAGVASSRGGRWAWRRRDRHQVRWELQSDARGVSSVAWCSAYTQAPLLLPPRLRAFNQQAC